MNGQGMNDARDGTLHECVGALAHDLRFFCLAALELKLAWYLRKWSTEQDRPRTRRRRKPQIAGLGRSGIVVFSTDRTFSTSQL